MLFILFNGTYRARRHAGAALDAFIFICGYHFCFGIAGNDSGRAGIRALQFIAIMATNEKRKIAVCFGPGFLKRMQASLFKSVNKAMNTGMPQLAVNLA
jgi:hypothetical protein